MFTSLRASLPILGGEQEGEVREKAFSEGGGASLRGPRALRGIFSASSGKASRTSEKAGGRPSLLRRPAPSKSPPSLVADR
eukprot:2264358-Pyramimonas_sp.AAC.1